MADLCDYDIEVLKAMAGQPSEAFWGAAMGECIEFLAGSGYAELVSTYCGIEYRITDKGEKALAEHG